MEQFINQQSTTNKQHEDQFMQLKARIDQLIFHNRILENKIVQQASSTPQPLEDYLVNLNFSLKNLVKLST